MTLQRTELILRPFRHPPLPNIKYVSFFFLDRPFSASKQLLQQLLPGLQTLAYTFQAGTVQFLWSTGTTHTAIRTLHIRLDDLWRELAANPLSQEDADVVYAFVAHLKSITFQVLPALKRVEIVNKSACVPRRIPLHARIQTATAHLRARGVVVV